MTRAPDPRSPSRSSAATAASRLRAVPAQDADAAADPPGRSPRCDGWTLDRQTAFLRALSATHSVAQAAQSVGRSRQSAYRLRSRLKGQPFDLAWEVAFHHSFDVLAHAALERALNGVERPVFYKGEQVGSYRLYDESLTRALLRAHTMGGNPLFGRVQVRDMAERHARDFESLLERIGKGEAVATGALTPADPDEFRRQSDDPAPAHACPSGFSDAEIMKILQDNGWK